jgi:hypothetical protein
MSAMLVSATSALGFEGLAILGDSSSTGAAAHPKLEFDSKVLWDVFNGAIDLRVDPSLVPADFQASVGSLEPPTRVGPSTRENDGGSGWIWHNFSQKISAMTLESHQLSYGYLAGRKLGIPARDILIGGENGTTSRHAWIHAARLVGARNRDLPSKVVFFYTGNDLCAQSFDDVIAASDYGDELLKGMKYLVLNGHADARGTKIFIPGFLPVTTLLHEPTILEHKIKLHGEIVSCKEARDRLFGPKLDQTKPVPATKVESDLMSDPRFQVFSAFMPPSPVLLCPTLFGKMAEDSVRQSLLANRVRGFRDAQKKAVDDFNQWRGLKFPAKAFEAVYIGVTETIKFEGSDVAGDCFHLSAAGQGKVASAMLTELR